MRALLCLSLFLLGCSSQQWDAGFLRVGGYATQWDKKHLPIKINSRDCAEHFAVCEAALEIDMLLGMQVFTVVKNALPNLIIKRCDSDCGVAGGISALHFRNQYIVGATIKIKQMAEPKARLVALHELGHVLGLAHDADPTSVMHGNAGSFFIAEKKFTKRDVAALRRVYH